MDKVLTKKDIQESLVNLSGLALNEGVLPDNNVIQKFPCIYKMISANKLPSFMENGFQRTLTDPGKDAYGDGVYSSLLCGGEYGASRLAYSYGTTMLVIKVIDGFKNYIMIPGRDPGNYIKKLIAQYYGSPYVSLEEQYYSITNDRELSVKLARMGTSVNEKYYGMVDKLYSYGVRGMIYDWCGEAPTVLPFDFSSTILWGYIENVGREEPSDSIWKRFKFYLTPENREKVEALQNDWAFQLKGLFDDFDKHTLAKVNSNKNVGYCIVKKDGKYNFAKVDISLSSSRKKPKVVSSVWFDERPTYPSIKTGIFEFKKYGIRWYGALFLPDDPKHLPVFWYPETEDPEMLKHPEIEFSDGWAYLVDDQMNWAVQDYKERFMNYRTVSESLIKNFRKFLNEEIRQNSEEEFLSKNYVRLWKVVFQKDLKSIFQYGQLRQFAGMNDSWYSEGVYTCLSPENLQFGRYGDCILEMVLVGGFQRFLIFDEKWAKRVYGENYTIEGQLRTLLPREIAEEEITKIRRRYGDTTYLLTSNRTVDVLNMMFKDGKGRYSDHDGPVATYYNKLFSKYNVRGAVYHGLGDGFCAVCWNFNDVVPYRYSLDHGHTWRKDLFDFNQAKKRASVNGDVVKRFRHKFLNVDDSFVKCNIGGNVMYVTCVETESRKFNIININNGNKISPFDFDSKPLLSTKGIFDFVYQGVKLQGIVLLPSDGVPAFWFPENMELNSKADINKPDDWAGFEDLQKAVEIIKGE